MINSIISKHMFLGGKYCFEFAVDAENNLLMNIPWLVFSLHAKPHVDDGGHSLCTGYCLINREGVVVCLGHITVTGGNY